jgi:hypothetical protein
MKKLAAVLSLMVLLAGCDGNKDLLEEKIYEQLVLELAILNQLDEQYLTDIDKEELRRQIFEHYGVTEDKFRITHDHYQQNVAEQLERMEELGILLRRERDKVQEAEREYRQSTQLPPDSLRMRILNRN